MATRPARRGNLSRISEIAQVAVRHGFGYFLETHRLRDLVPFRDRAQLDGATPSERGRHLREMLEELGPTFVKFGQLLSMRPDVLPPDVIAELRALQDDVITFPFDEARLTIERDLENTLERLFVEFDERPVAAASIGQVHRAVLPRGRHREGARSRVRLHRRRGARRRVCALDPPGARLPARGPERPALPPQLRGPPARRDSARVLELYERARPDDRVSRGRPARGRRRELLAR